MKIDARRSGAVSIAMALMVLLGLVVAATPASAQTIALGYGGSGWTGFSGSYGSPARTTQRGGCLFLSANPGIGAPSSPIYAGTPGLPRMDTYGSIDWNSHNDGSGTPCTNKSFAISGGDFYMVQWLMVWNWNTGVWDPCNKGPNIYNPGPYSHAIATGYSWLSPPCWDHAVYDPSAGANEIYYTQQSSIADI